MRRYADLQPVIVSGVNKEMVHLSTGFIIFHILFIVVYFGFVDMYFAFCLHMCGYIDLCVCILHIFSSIP